MRKRPHQQRREGSMSIHPLENAFIWFFIQLAEFAVVVLAVRFVLPDNWPWAVYVAIWLTLLIGLAAANYTIRRRFIPH